MSETTTLKHERKTGKSTDYETDGTNYWLAPSHVDAWGEIQDQERALDEIIAATARAVAGMRSRVESQRRRWWDRVYEDLGLDRTVVYSFQRLAGKMAPVVREKD